MTSTTRTTPPRTTRRTVRSLALALSAAAVATATSAALGSAPLAQADPGDTFVAIGTSQLLQSEDLVSIQVPLDTQTVELNRDNDFSSCLGEGNPWTGVLPGAPMPITSTWTSRSHDDQALNQNIAQAKTAAQAKRYTTILLRDAVRLCREGSSRFDFHYGPTQWSRVGSGTATWALSYTGDERRPDGGVVVFRKGTNFGIIHVNGTFGSAEQTMESVAKEAVDRLVWSQ